MSKKYFIMNNRENTSEGYREVSMEEFKNYMMSFPKRERFCINLGYAVMETTEESYHNFYKDVNRNETLRRLDAKNGLVSYSALDTNEFNGADIIEDPSDPLEDRILRSQMIEKLLEAIALLSDEDKELIEMLYFDGMSEREITRLTGVARTTINYRRNRILKKKSSFFEKNSSNTPFFSFYK
ncbi:MAG: sigma-70 family RNA polymerase sigma factor [Ruminococcus sp.]|nr:sigma-70 family RNA polymerase sigma factor [Ruminococcus sp.]